MSDDPAANDIMGKVLAALDCDGVGDALKSEVIELIIERRAWGNVSPVLEEILLMHRSPRHAAILANVFLSASFNKLGFDCDRVVALLLRCGVESGSNTYNAILSICCEMKGVEYQSRYSPSHDPGIIGEMNKIAEIRAGDE